MSTAEKTLRISNNVKSTIVNNEAVVLDLRTEDLIGFNSSGTEVWQNIGKKMSIGDIVLCVATRFGQPEDAIRSDVLRFVQELIDKGLVVLV